MAAVRSETNKLYSKIKKIIFYKSDDKKISKKTKSQKLRAQQIIYKKIDLKHKSLYILKNKNNIKTATNGKWCSFK